MCVCVPHNTPTFSLTQNYNFTPLLSSTARILNLYYPNLPLIENQATYPLLITYPFFFVKH